MGCTSSIPAVSSRRRVAPTSSTTPSPSRGGDAETRHIVHKRTKLASARRRRSSSTETSTVSIVSILDSHSASIEFRHEAHGWGHASCRHGCGRSFPLSRGDELVQHEASCSFGVSLKLTVCHECRRGGVAGTIRHRLAPLQREHACGCGRPRPPPPAEKPLPGPPPGRPSGRGGRGRSGGGSRRGRGGARGGGRRSTSELAFLASPRPPGLPLHVVPTGAPSSPSAPGIPLAYSPAAPGSPSPGLHQLLLAQQGMHDVDDDGYGDDAGPTLHGARASRKHGGGHGDAAAEVVPPCHLAGIRPAMRKYVTSLQPVKVTCLQCGLGTVMEKEFHVHLWRECSAGTVHCPQCGDAVLRCHMDVHADMLCAYRLVQVRERERERERMCEPYDPL